MLVLELTDAFESKMNVLDFDTIAEILGDDRLVEEAIANMPPPNQIVAREAFEQWLKLVIRQVRRTR